MTKLEKAKEIIKENFSFARCGLFGTRNTIGDPMYTVYADGELVVDICFRYEYFEVFGLSEAEFEVLCDFYESLVM